MPFYCYVAAVTVNFLIQGLSTSLFICPYLIMCLYKCDHLSLSLPADRSGCPANPLINLLTGLYFIVCLFRKKKKDKESKHRLEQVANSEADEEVKSNKAYVDKRTPAQMAFDKMQEKRVSCGSLALKNHSDSQESNFAQVND